MNEIDATLFLEKQSIFMLRGMARLCGAQKPTTLPKRELVDNIMSTLLNFNNPNVSDKSKRGRPPLITAMYNMDCFNIINRASEILYDTVDSKFYDQLACYIVEKSDGLSSADILDKFKNALAHYDKKE